MITNYIKNKNVERFWNNLHRVRLKSKEWKVKQKFQDSIETKMRFESNEEVILLWRCMTLLQ
jgi:hypothetical protein